MSSSALSQDCVLSHVATFLDLLDLCSLDGASRDISDDIADWEGSKPCAWLTVAGREGLSVMGVESKSCIKAAFGAIRGHDFRPEKFRMRSAKDTQELTKAAHQMKSMKTKHMTSGGRIGASFLTYFQFNAKAVDAQMLDPSLPVPSNPVPMTIGKDVIKMILIWQQGTMWLSVSATSRSPFAPIGIQLRTVASPLTMRKSFNLWYLHDEPQKGEGLCCVLRTPEALANDMKLGILCAGFVGCLDSVQASIRSANAMQLDQPRYRIQ